MTAQVDFNQKFRAMAKAIHQVLRQKITWAPLPGSERDFISENLPQDCYLRMNNFPEEPLWTLIYQGERIDIEEAPLNWQIIYRSEL